MRSESIGIREAMYPASRIKEISTPAILLLVILGSFFALLPSWLNYDIISMDGAFQYIPSASLFLQGEFLQGLSRPQLPLFPVLIALVSKITGLDLEISGRVVSATCFIIASVGLFKVSELVFKDKVLALMAVFFLITNRQFAVCSVDCLKESLLVCLIIWGNYFIISSRSEAKSAGRLYAGFGLLVMGAMVRSTAVIFLAAWLILWVLHKKQGAVIRGIILMIPVVSFVMLWWMFPDLQIFKKSFDLSLLSSSPYTMADKSLAGTMIIVNFFSTGNPILVLAACIGLYHYRQKDHYYYHLICVLALFFLILVMWGFTSDRYLLAPIIWMYPLASFEIMRIFQTGAKMTKAFAILTVLSCIVLWADIAFTPPDKDKLARKEAGQWILDRRGPDQEIISNRDRLVFYAQGKYKPLSTYQSKKRFNSVLAIDVKFEEGRALVKEIRSHGIDSDKQFRSIYVYLPDSLSLD